MLFAGEKRSMHAWKMISLLIEECMLKKEWIHNIFYKAKNIFRSMFTNL